MKKVYVVWYIPDYIGIDIVGIFLNEVDALDCLKKFRLEDGYNIDNSGVDEYEVQ